MDAFSYLSVLLSIILGLAITQVLQGFGRLMQARARVQVYWPPVVIAAVLLLSFVQSWWAMFGLRSHANWTFLGFFVVILQTIFSYLQAALILPDFVGEAPVDLRANYFAHARWFYLMVIGGTLTSLAKDVTLDGRLPEWRNLCFHLIWIGMASIAALTRRDGFHKLVAGSAVVINIAYIAMLFARLQ